MGVHSSEPVKKPTIWYSVRLREEVRLWPEAIRQEMGSQLNKVEYGGEPDDFKSMKTVGPGVIEIRVSGKDNEYRLFYVAKFDEAIYVLHVISKKQRQKTAQSDIDLAKYRFGELLKKRRQRRIEEQEGRNFLHW